MYRGTAILGRVHAAFFNYYHFSEMTNMLDEIVLARIMMDLDLEFKRALHYSNKGYDSNNDWSAKFSYEAYTHFSSVNNWGLFLPWTYKGAQCPTTPFTPGWPSDDLCFCQGVCWQLTFDETPLPKMDSDDEEEYFPTADLDHPVWSEEPIPSSCQQLCIHQTTCHTPRPATWSLQPIQEELPTELEQMDMEILDDLPDIINVSKEPLSDTESY